MCFEMPVDMPVIQFGSLQYEVEILTEVFPQDANSLGSIEVTPVTTSVVQAPAAPIGGSSTQSEEVDYTESTFLAFSKLEKDLAPMFQARSLSRVRKQRNGTCYYKRKSPMAIQRHQKRQARLAKEKDEFLNSPPSVISKITIAGGPAPSAQLETPAVKWPLHKTPSRRVRVVHRPVSLSDREFGSFLAQLKGIMSQKNMAFELIDRKPVRGKYRRACTNPEVIMELPHMHGVKRQRELKFTEWQSQLVLTLAKYGSWESRRHTSYFKKGDSGLVINEPMLTGPRGMSVKGLFVIRGAHEGKLYNALTRVTSSVLHTMTHYSEAETFWKGYNKEWINLKAQTDHECVRHYSVEECGQVASIMTQALFPCGKITCLKCSEKVFMSSQDELLESLRINADLAEKRLMQSDLNFPHVQCILQTVAQASTTANDDQKIFDTVFRMVGDKQQGPFKQLNELNQFFGRGTYNDKAAWTRARNSLLELAQFQKNRTDNIKKGDLNSFRNKLSGKANYNLSLSCDNQLDANANFRWGQREYHAKRFFSNFFEKIDPTKGYNNYIIRRNPAGARKLAIGNLIVPLDLAEFRARMKGEFVRQPGISRKCVSTKDGNFIYPCCCTTNEDGSPIESGLYAPTMNHMVIGNSSESKFVDLPKGETDDLYIAKDGYCYINIFLAMLVNIRESQAKDFTKKVRDLCVPKLGEWPTVIDLATTCAQLKIFYPDVHSAELPRILVDHVTQTCHVVDSYGSLTTGYHVLKASTVAQFVLLASDELDSDIKHYRVGGKKPFGRAPDLSTLESDLEVRTGEKSPLEVSSWNAIKLLIKGIYRDEVMKQILLEEPYLLVVGAVSPGVLMAMFNSGVFEKAMRTWISHDQSLVVIATYMSMLARKVSVADSLMQQHQIIQEAAGPLMEIMVNGVKTQFSYYTGLTTLQVLSLRGGADKELILGGYVSNEASVLKVMEKSYLAILEEEWSALSWLGKLRAAYSSYKQQKSIVKPLHPTVLADFEGRYNISPRVLVTNASEVSKKAICTGYSRVTGFVHNRVVNTASYFINVIIRKLPKLNTVFNTLFVFSAFFNLFSILYSISSDIRRDRDRIANMEFNMKEAQCDDLYRALEVKLGRRPDLDEFVSYVKGISQELGEFADMVYQPLEEEVHHQKVTEGTKKIEQIVAFMTLVMMMFDAERSDCVFKTLNKLKSTISTMDYEVRHQSLDEIADTLDDKKLTIDFELSDDILDKHGIPMTTFGDWWINQIERGHLTPHYRTEGKFMEFTRDTALQVANDIIHSNESDFLIRGAVGSGKSTGLPFNISRKGTVLLIEPTRPLAENVFKQLGGAPFFAKPTLRMRGVSHFGSSPITVMTSGYALHYFANNIKQLHCIDFVIIDECHVLDASAMAFRCLIKEYHTRCKVLKVSATPPGREVEFKTQFPVDLRVEESLSFRDFVSALGTGANSDVLTCGVNILVYVASYSEVDSLSKLLIEKKFLVSKVDGRTMKHGDVEIATKGTKTTPHFVVATNIIENGVTLDIDVVVDFGRKVQPVLDTDNRSVAYNKVSVSYGERIQRLGRVGRIKPGTALRIGHTEKGLVEVPAMIATEAALYCFAYNLPVMSGGVSTNLVHNCTIPQVKTMHCFELSPFYTVNVVAFDGTMHPEIHRLLKQYKLRDSEIPLREQSIPYKASASWLSVRDYERIGVRLALAPEVKVAFHIGSIPDTLHEKVWEATQLFKGCTQFPSIRSSSICKIAYTLRTDVEAIPRTLAILDKLIEDERAKQCQFRSIIDGNCSGYFSLLQITNTLRAKYAKDHTSENIQKLESARTQLKEFQNLGTCVQDLNVLKQYEALQYVHHQSKNEMSKGLELKGKWNKSLIARDGIIVTSVIVGGVWMLYSWFTNSVNEVRHQGLNGKKRVKALKFRKLRDKRMGTEVYGDDATIEDYFGSAYTKKGKGKGTVKGMGHKTRRFINMYGFDPAEYSYIKFVDPLTGHQIEENVFADILTIQEQMGDARNEAIRADTLESQHVYAKPGIQAYVIKEGAKTALKVDLTPHVPLKMCDNTNAIAGFPDRAYELRQTGPAKEIDIKDVPKDEVSHESKSLMKGPMDFNPIAKNICRITNDSDGIPISTYGIGFGGYMIANQHFFKRNNGLITFKTHHGVFKAPNSTVLKIFPIKGRDLVVVELPKDFPVFSNKIHFRSPKDKERVCMVSSIFQEKSVTSTVSESSPIFPVAESGFYKHWISTDDGSCGLPLVSVVDGKIVGIHSLANNYVNENYFTAFEPHFETNVLRSPEALEWIKHWKYNPENISWGYLSLNDSAPSGLFKTTKLVTDLVEDEQNSVRWQGTSRRWMFDALQENLQAVAYVPSQLVTKHVVKGKCHHFDQFLAEDKGAREFFKPKMDAYGKSNLNREAYIKDIMKYSKPITVGVVDCPIFEEAVCRVIMYMRVKGFKECTFVTDEESIFNALNMKAAVGALYGGKKKDYFEKFTPEQKEQILRDSCRRLYEGKLGVWTGSLKSELRPMEKVLANKTRTFTAAPIDTLLAGKVCVDDFNNQFYSKNIECCWTVGMTKFYGGWNKLLTALPDGWLYCDADGSQFDSSLTPYLINAVLGIRLAFMEDWDIGFKMLENLYTEIIYTPISTPDGTVVKKFRGNNSGQPSTVVDNSLMVVLAMNYCFVKEGYAFEEVDSICRFFVNGDDLLIAVNPTHESLLDRMGDHFSTLGLNYTFDSRTKNKEDLWFMSHCGISVEGMYIPKLEEERIVSILQWDRAALPEHRMEAICAAMIESWGYPELTHQIRRFYAWLLEKEPFSSLVSEGKAPYIAETALKRLYMNNPFEESELDRYLKAFADMDDEFECCTYEVYHESETQERFSVRHQSGPGDVDTTKALDAGKKPAATQNKDKAVVNAPQSSNQIGKEADVNVGTKGTFAVPKVKSIHEKMLLPKAGGKVVLNLDHLLEYEPSQINISNTRATMQQFNKWYDAVKTEYGVEDDGMGILLNGLMVWCIENGTSPNVNGVWVMMDGEEQVEYSLKPIVENAKPTLRQIMAHFSNVAEAYIEKRNLKEPYMPRYGLVRNLRDPSLARYAFDFYEVTSKTPNRVREAHMQMKAAALKSTQTRLFGLDGGVGTQEENTERHTTEDVSTDMHTLLGVRNM